MLGEDPSTRNREKPGACEEGGLAPEDVAKQTERTRESRRVVTFNGRTDAERGGVVRAG